MRKKTVVGEDGIDFHLVPHKCEQKIVLQYLRDLFRLTRLVKLRFVVEQLLDSPCSHLRGP